MDTLRTILPAEKLEMYSIAEAFLDIYHVAPGQYHAFALAVRETVEQWTGIRVSVGVGPGKVLAKMANMLSKEDKEKPVSDGAGNSRKYTGCLAVGEWFGAMGYRSVLCVDNKGKICHP